MLKKQLQVKLGKNSYPIFIDKNILRDSGKIISNLGNFSSVIIITDNTVEKIYLDSVKKSLKQKFSKVSSITLPYGEKTKSYYFLKLLLDKILAKKIDRQCLLIALGGGVIGDLVGFVSSLLLRGVSYVQIPTTLLAQVDSSVGGKTGINSKYGKNLIGSFKQPLCVITSLETLSTLPKRELFSGYAEILKYSFIQDENFFEWLDKFGIDLLNLNYEKLEYAVKKSCMIKSKIVSLDEKEHGQRAFLNFGHTFGHAIESLNNYSANLKHGEAILIGMIIAIKLSINLKLCNFSILPKVVEHYKKLGLNFNFKNLKISTTVDEFVDRLYYDKKVKAGKINFILIEKIGLPVIFNKVKRAEIKNLIKNEL